LDNMKLTHEKCNQ